MARHRLFWSVLWPVFAVLVAASLGVAVAWAISAVGGPQLADSTERNLVLAYLELDMINGAARGFANVSEWTGVLAGLGVSGLAWMVMLGIGAQKLYRAGHRMLPAVVTIVGATAVGWAVIAIMGADGQPVIALEVVTVLAVTAVLGGAAFPWWSHHETVHEADEPPPPRRDGGRASLEEFFARQP